MKEQEGIPWIEIAAEKEREIQQLRKEKEELRNKVIEEAIAKVTDRYGERISKATLIELLNSLKTK